MEQFAQIAEREIWLIEGWKWQDYPKSGHIITRDRGSLGKIILRFILDLLPFKKAKFLLQRLDRNPKWVEVEIVF